MTYQAGTWRDPRQVSFGLRQRTVVDRQGVTVERSLRQWVVVPAVHIAAVTTHPYFRGHGAQRAALLCPGHKPILLWATMEHDASWESRQIAKVLKRPWVPWRDRRPYLHEDYEIRAH
ncbi:hypothetical protein [Jannaschia sp. R86511]|uniref:hypothetical protein n=1 Tax=Jannaschia sp. R86511 TaxID=3093853 RepID=UPI0036D3706B